MEEKTVVPQRPLKSPGFAGVLRHLPVRGRRPLQRPVHQGPALPGRLRRARSHAGPRGSGQPFMAAAPGRVLSSIQFFDNIQSAKAINAAAAGQTPAGRRRPGAAGDPVAGLDLLGHRPHRPGRRAHPGQFRGHPLRHACSTSGRSRSSSSGSSSSSTPWPSRRTASNGGLIMARQKNGDSLVWGIILIVVGAIFLLEQFDIDVFDQVWRFWPVILIVWGANKLYLGLKETERAPRRPARTKAMKFKEVLLVVVLILAGLVFYQFKTGHWNLDDGLGLGRRSRHRRQGGHRARRRGRSRRPCRRRSRSRTATAGSRCAARTRTIVQLTFKKVVWRRKEEEAREIAGPAQVHADDGGGQADPGHQPGRVPQEELRDGLRPDRPQVDDRPRHQRLRRRPHRGRQGGHGPQPPRRGLRFERGRALRARDELRRPRGPEHPGHRAGSSNSHADVRAAAVTGDLAVETSYARIRVEDAGGKADLRGSNTDVEAKRVAGRGHGRHVL